MNGKSDKGEYDDEDAASELEIGKCMFAMEFEVREGMEKRAKSFMKNPAHRRH